MINIKQRYQKGKIIGRGSFGEVYEVTEKNTEDDTTYAAKIYFQEVHNESSDQFNEIKNELQILYKLNHPSIIKFIGYSMKNFENQPKPTIIMEICQNGSLRDIILSILKNEKPKQWTNTKIMINIYGIASGMLYLHSNNVIHRDLKPENILLNEYLYPKITDFGLSKITSDVSEINNFSIKGTPSYMAPESFDGNFSDASDVYSFAIILYEIITNTNPNNKLGQVQTTIRALRFGFLPDFPQNFPESYKNLILRCGSKDSEKRPKFNEIVDILENDEQFILPDTDLDEYNNYINYIKEYQATFLSKSLNIQFDDYLKTKNTTIQKVSLKTSDFQQTNTLYPYDKYLNLNNECKRLVCEAEKSADVKFIVGKFCIEGENGFPVDLETGLSYLKQSIKEDCLQSILYYSRMQIRGKRIPRNIRKAKERLDKVEESKRNGEFYLLYGRILRKEKDYENAKKYLNKAMKRGNAEAMNIYGKMFLYGEGCESSKERSLQYFEMAQRNDYQKASEFIALIDVDRNNPKKLLKVLFIGDSSIGKTILIESLSFRPFHQTISSAGFNTDIIFYGISRDQSVKLIVTDTAGQEVYANAIPPKLYRDNDAICVCYSMDLEDSIPKWIGRARDANPNCKIILVETKADLLSDEQKERNIYNGNMLKDTYNCYKYILSSSITKEGVKNILKYAAELAVPITEETNNSVNLTENETQVNVPERKKCC